MRRAFLVRIPAVCAFLGAGVAIERVLPCIENGLLDLEERVVVSTADCLTILLELGILSTTAHVLIPLVKRCAPLVLHPCASIRIAIYTFFETAIKLLGPVDTAVFILPLFRPVQQYVLPGLVTDFAYIRR